LAAKLRDLAERERKGVASIREALTREQAADAAPTGLKAALLKATGRSAADASDRQARATQRVEQAERDIAALKASLRAEANSFALEQGRESTALRQRHAGEGQQLVTAASAKRDFDRTAEVHARREQARGIEQERQQGRGRDSPESTPG
jgi:hypothetical protein